jgi:hypothetical protein
VIRFDGTTNPYLFLKWNVKLEDEESIRRWSYGCNNKMYYVRCEADCLHFLYLLAHSIPQIPSSSQIFDTPPGFFGLALIFLEDPHSEFGSVHGAARLVVCLYHQCCFCHIHKESHRHTLPSVADHLRAWLPRMNS